MAEFNIGFANHKCMFFIDGENLTIRAQEFVKDKDFTLKEGSCFQSNVFVWIPGVSPVNLILSNPSIGSYSNPMRSYFYTSLVGDDDKLNEVEIKLWNLGFHPEVFKKDKQSTKAKGVDIALSKDFLSHGFMNNYDLAFLVSGDADYIPLVREVKRIGKIVCLVFFSSSGLSPKLKKECDYFFSIDDQFTKAWRKVK